MLYICKYIYIHIAYISRDYILYVLYTYMYIYVYITMIQTEKNLCLVVVWSYNQFI